MTKTLRELALATKPLVDGSTKAIQAFYAAASPDAIIALLDRIAELERDAARYQHIRLNDQWMVIYGMRQSPFYMGRELDAAIDAAMKGPE